MKSQGKAEHKKFLDVLLLEDDPIVQHVHHYMLERLSCRVDSAATGLEALEKLHQKMQMPNTPYDIVFVDLGLPDIAGFEVIKRIHDLKVSQSIESPNIVVLTCYSASEQKSACEALGANHVLQKPVDIQAMRQFLSQFNTTSH